MGVGGRARRRCRASDLQRAAWVCGAEGGAGKGVGDGRRAVKEDLRHRAGQGLTHMAAPGETNVAGRPVRTRAAVATYHTAEGGTSLAGEGRPRKALRAAGRRGVGACRGASREAGGGAAPPAPSWTPSAWRLPARACGARRCAPMRNAKRAREPVARFGAVLVRPGRPCLGAFAIVTKALALPPPSRHCASSVPRRPPAAGSQKNQNSSRLMHRLNRLNTTV